MEAYSLASGSRGNACAVREGEALLLIDGGRSCRYLKTCLASAGLGDAALCGVLVTHGHTDHVAGLPRFLAGCRVPVYGTAPALAALPPEADCRGQALSFSVTVGPFRVTSVPLSHDSPGTVGYRIDSSSGDSFALATDTGVVTPAMASLLPGCRGVLLEANHDRVMLDEGPYPPALKARVRSPLGHLSNEAAASFAVRLAAAGTEALMLGHLSQHNNTPALAVETVRRALAEAGFALVPTAAEPDRIRRIL